MAPWANGDKFMNIYYSIDGIDKDSYELDNWDVTCGCFY